MIIPSEIISYYLYLSAWRFDILWAVFVSFLLAFLLAFAVGANDSANSWGTSVGAGTLSLRTAQILGSIMEILGAMFLSANVIKKITTGIISVDPYYTSQNVTDIFDDENKIFEHLWGNGTCYEFNCNSTTNFTEPITFNFINDTLKPETELILGQS